jgi:hypothetical protein
LEEQLALSDVDPAYMWFIDLTRELEDLETGIIPPVFRCRGGRNGLSTVEWLRRFAVVEAIELFHATGMKYDDAARRVILAYKPGVSASKALSWCKEFKKRTVMNKEAAELYEDMMAVIPTSGAQDLRRQIAILTLRAAIQATALDGRYNEAAIRKAVSFELAELIVAERNRALEDKT